VKNQYLACSRYARGQETAEIAARWPIDRICEHLMLTSSLQLVVNEDRHLASGEVIGAEIYVSGLGECKSDVL
jgi:hypothetical protein